MLRCQSTVSGVLGFGAKKEKPPVVKRMGNDESEESV